MLNEQICQALSGQDQSRKKLLKRMQAELVSGIMILCRTVRGPGNAGIFRLFPEAAGNL
jgi:hypothetical protein